MKTKDKLIEELWVGAEVARKDALRAALRDPWMWAEQAVVVLLAIVKVTVLSLVLALCLRLLDVPDQAARMIGMLIVLLIVPFNPRRLFWRVIALDRADTAFEEFLSARRASR